jgi:hypothetical protein
MIRISSVLRVLGTLFISQMALAQLVLVNYIPTRPGDHDEPAGSTVIVKNTTNSDVTIQVPYDPPIVLHPGESTRFILNANPGGSTWIEGEGGNWRLNPR